MPPLTEEQKAQRALKRRRQEALDAERDHERSERRREQWEEEGKYLTREEIAAGVPCRGCGLLVKDGLGDWPGTMYLTAEQRAEYDSQDRDFRARHANCQSHRWSMSGSRATHCGHCCPPPPLSDRQIRAVTQILGRSRPHTDDLTTWRLQLTCDHVVEKQAHKSHRSWSPTVVPCPRCEAMRGVVSSEPRPAANDDDLEQREVHGQQVAAVEGELARLRGQVREAEKRLNALRKR